MSALNLSAFKLSAAKFHRLNGYVFAAFLALHFATHLSGLFGIDTYNAVQSALRGIYRAAFVEPIVLISAVSQIVFGAILGLRKWRRGLRGRWEKAQVISGAVLIYFMAQHLIAMGLARGLEGLDTNFYWPASVMSGAPFLWYFGPYYALGVVALFVHLGCALRLGVMRGPRRAYATALFWGMAAAGVVIAILINLMLLGVFYDIALPAEWIGYLQGFIPNYQP